MRKLSTLALLLMMGAMSAWSQTENIFRFVDKDGKEVPDGTELTITETEEMDDGFGGVSTIMPSGLYVENTTGEEASLRIHCQLQTLDNGLFQICFPTTCISKEAVETFDTPSGPLSSGEIKTLQTEWLPDTYGRCTAVYQVEVMKLISMIPLKYESLGMGPSVTVEYVYTDPAHIEEMHGDEANEPEACYNLNGIKRNALQRGLNIVRMKNGQVVKQLKQ